MSRKFLVFCIGCVLFSGCSSLATTQPQPLSERDRERLGRIWVQPSYDTAEATSGVTSGRGMGAAIGAGQATGAMWSEMGSGMSGDGAALGLLVLVALTPIVAAGGAVYGAAAADSANDVDQYLATLDQVYAATDATYARHLEQGIADLPYLDVAVGARPNAFDSRLVIQFNELTGEGGGVKSNLSFTLSTKTSLYIGDDTAPAYVRDYRFHTPVRRLAQWAEGDGSALRAEVDVLAASTVQALLDDHFRRSAYTVQPDYPAYRFAFRPKRLATDQPEFRWHLAEGEFEVDAKVPVTYELRISGEAGAFSDYHGLTVQRFTPPQPLPACARLEWLVRGHYQSMGQSRSTAWSEPQRFRTPCPGR